MELYNATGETLEHKYDNVPYVFPPNEIVKVTDECGKHIILKLGYRGLQEISFGDDPEKLSLIALRATVAYHEHQIETHDAQVRVAGESKNPVPAEPEGYKIAKRRLPAYQAVMEEREADAEAAATIEEDKKIRAAMAGQGPEIAPLEDKDIDELRDVVRSLGEEPNMRHGHKKLIAQIEVLRERADDEE